MKEIYLEKSRINQLNRIFKGVRQLKSDAHASEQIITKMDKLLALAQEHCNEYRRVLQVISNGEDPSSPGSLASASLLRKLADEALKLKID